MSLHIPPNDGNSLRIHRGFPPACRGAAGRRAAIIEQERKQKNVEAMMHTTVTCGTLWGGFWFQFVIGFMYNSPAIHTLSRGNWFAPYVQFYLPVHPLQSISLAENFAWLSVFGSLLALLGIWHWTSGVRGRRKMRMLVAGFAVFLSVWSLAALAGKDAAWQALEDRRIQIQNEMQENYDADMIRWLKSEKEGIEQMLKTR